VACLRLWRVPRAGNSLPSANDFGPGAYAPGLFCFQPSHHEQSLLHHYHHTIRYAAPHIGFALELAQADAIARQHRALRRVTRLQTGTDENAFKNVEAAAAAGVRSVDCVVQGRSNSGNWRIISISARRVA
jgi:hypothetical protein